MKEVIKKFWIFLGISMAFVSALVWLYFLIPFFIDPNSYQMLSETNRLISGIEILLQANILAVLIYLLANRPAA